MARAAKPDMLLSVGGGSAIDGVKMIQVALAEDIRTEAGFDAFHLSKDAGGGLVSPAIRASGLRQIAIPTTLSGAEFTHTAGSVDEKAKKKDLYVRRDLCPVSVILESAVTVHTPEWLWLSTAIRAVDHAVESMCALNSQPITDATCEQGLRMFGQNLRSTKRDPADLDARLNSQIGVWLATTGMARGKHGASHGIGYALGAVAGVPHGHCSCVLLPAVMRFNKPVNADKQARVSAALERPGVDAADALLELFRELGVPTTLREVNVTREQLPAIAANVVRNAHVRNNPRPIQNEADVMQVLETAW